MCGQNRQIPRTLLRGILTQRVAGVPLFKKTGDDL